MLQYPANLSQVVLGLSFQQMSEYGFRKNEVCAGVVHWKPILNDRVWAIAPCRAQFRQLKPKPAVRCKALLTPADRWSVHVESDVCARSAKHALKLDGHRSTPTSDIENAGVVSKQVENGNRRRDLTCSPVEGPNGTRVSPQPQGRNATAVDRGSDTAVDPVEGLQEPKGAEPGQPEKLNKGLRESVQPRA
jgi:hypothetical protein